MLRKLRLKQRNRFIIKKNRVDNQYRQKSEMLHTFRPNKSYAYSPSNLVVIIDL